ncbi:MAG: hypothetical protein H6539_08545 [Bacteroidales bacterium]|nr:hypothetical protein [Bacteroidales bacterium]
MFKFLLILLLVFLVLRMLGRMFFTSYVYTNDSRTNNTGDRSKEGSVSVENKPKTEKVFKKDDGEYVDYEEVK